MMKKHLRILVPVLLLLIAVSACKEERDTDWEKAATLDRPEGYRAYIKAHPDSQYLEMAKYQLERLVYRQAMDQNTAAGYTAYLREFPQGHYIINARDSRNTIIAHQLRKMPDNQLATARVRFETDQGSFTIQVFPDKAPVTSRNFLTLAAGGFYDGLLIHRVEPKLLVQTGDPRGDSLGGPGYFIAYENTGLPHLRGSVVMWHPPVDPNTAGSQFFVLLAPLPKLGGKYASFGQVVDGLDKLDAISEAPSTGPNGIPPYRPLKRITVIRAVVEGLEIK
jgi:cyclophilin family peptidyl-prolyl cis-trans isomerase